jgi:hypothetical protein
VLRLVVRWPVLDLDARLWDLERVARAEWAGHVAEQGLWGTLDPVFHVEPGDTPHLVGTGDVLHGPMELRSGRAA